MIQATWLKDSLCATHYVYVWEGSSDLFFILFYFIYFKTYTYQMP